MNRENIIKKRIEIFNTVFPKENIATSKKGNLYYIIDKKTVKTILKNKSKYLTKNQLKNVNSRTEFAKDVIKNAILLNTKTGSIKIKTEQRVNFKTLNFYDMVKHFIHIIEPSYYSNNTSNIIFHPLAESVLKLFSFNKKFQWLVEYPYLAGFICSYNFNSYEEFKEFFDIKNITDDNLKTLIYKFGYSSLDVLLYFKGKFPSLMELLHNTKTSDAFIISDLFVNANRLGISINKIPYFYNEETAQIALNNLEPSTDVKVDLIF